MPSKIEMTTWLDLFTWNLNLLTSSFYYILFQRVAQVDTRRWKFKKRGFQSAGLSTFHLDFCLCLLQTNADKKRIDSSVDLLPARPINHSVEQRLFTDFSGKPGHVNERLMCVEPLKNCMVTSPYLMNTHTYMQAQEH